jgi:hypothetical protein
MQEEDPRRAGRDPLQNFDLLVLSALIIYVSVYTVAVSKLYDVVGRLLSEGCVFFDLWLALFVYLCSSLLQYRP